MNVLVLRRKRFWENKKRQELLFDNIRIKIVYIIKVNKRVRRYAAGFDLAVSLDFEQFFVKSRLMEMFAAESFEKIALRHGGVDTDVLEAQVDILNEKNAEILVKLALKARYVIIHGNIAGDKFDFLCDEAGVSPEFAGNDFRHNLVVYLGEEFLIKHVPTGKIYYDVFLWDRKKYFVPEMNMIFSEFLRLNPCEMNNVKIRDLMSK